MVHTSTKRSAAFAFRAFVIVALAGSSPGTFAQSPKTLQERARANAGTLTEQLAVRAAPQLVTLADMCARSPIVVVGTVMARRGHLSKDGATVQTDLALRVQDVVKGTVRAGSVLYVAVPGGSFRFTDGAKVHQVTNGYLRPRPGHQYVLFLRPLVAAAGAKADYELALAAQGQFELDRSVDKVRPANTDRHSSLAKRYTNMKVAPFLAELHRAAWQPQ
jgi:hypothetical protein